MAASETANGRLRTGGFRGLLVFLACVLVFELGVARQPALRERILGGSLRKVEQLLIAPAPAPEALIFGNSRMLYGVDERQLADQAGLARPTVLKMAMTSTSPSEYLYLYRRNRPKLAHARLVIIGVDDWEIAHSWRMQPEDVYHATLYERLTVPDWRYAPVALLTWCCRSTYMFRAVLSSAARKATAVYGPRALRKRFAVPPPRSRLESGLFGERDPVTEQASARGEWDSATGTKAKAAGHLRMSALKMVDHQCASLPPLGAGGWRQVQRLTELCVQDGATVLIVQPPLRDEYLQILGQRYPRYAQAWRSRAAEMEQWAQASGGRVQVRLYGSASQHGLSTRAFYDYGHPSPLGRTFLTRELATWLREQPTRGRSQ